MNLSASKKLSRASWGRTHVPSVIHVATIHQVWMLLALNFMVIFALCNPSIICCSSTIGADGRKNYGDHLGVRLHASHLFKNRWSHRNGPESVYPEPKRLSMASTQKENLKRWRSLEFSTVAMRLGRDRRQKLSYLRAYREEGLRLKCNSLNKLFQMISLCFNIHKCF